MLTFQELYETYVTDVYRFSLWLSGSRSDADDITSETFVRAWTHRYKIRTETLKAYLITIARNVFLSQERRSRRQVELAPDYPDSAPGPDMVIEDQQTISNVWKDLQTFKEIDRTAFFLRVQYELPYAEIARILGISQSASKVKVHRIRKKLLIRNMREEGEP